MGRVARGQDQDSVTTDHDCDTETTCNGASTTVFVNGYGVHRKGDATASHEIEDGDDCISHLVGEDPPTISTGSSTVLANGLGVARVDDAYEECGYVDSGSDTVFAG